MPPHSGESLLNDGTAIVIFELLLKTLQDARYYCRDGSSTPCPAGSTYVYGDHWTGPEDVIITFGYMAFGGVGFGLLMAMALTQWISQVYNDAMIEITLTITFAYLTFFLAEELNMSGVLSEVALGLYMAKKGRSRVSPQLEEFLTEFWELLAYFGNTLIFVVRIPRHFCSPSILLSHLAPHTHLAWAAKMPS